MTAEDRMAEFGVRLRLLRQAAGLSGTHLAESVGWSHSKVSRIQSADQNISDDDVKTWCRATGADEKTRDELLAELRSIRLDQARWKSRLRRGHQQVQAETGFDEQQAAVIRNFETGLVNGLLQTPDYARAVFTQLSRLKGTPNDADEAVPTRMERQAILYDTNRRIELLVAEAALRSPIAPRKVMTAQYDRLVALLGVSTVKFGVIPLDVTLPLPLLHGASIIDDTVKVETLYREIVTRDPEDVELYNSAFDDLWQVAAQGDAARDILIRLLSPA